jgi:hypothetical protein
MTSTGVPVVGQFEMRSVPSARRPRNESVGFPSCDTRKPRESERLAPGFLNDWNVIIVLGSIPRTIRSAKVVSDHLFKINRHSSLITIALD